MTTVAMSISLQIFLLDVAQVKVLFFLKKNLFDTMNRSNLSSSAPQYPTDRGLLRLHDFVCEPGLGRRLRPFGWVFGGPQ